MPLQIQKNIDLYNKKSTLAKVIPPTCLFATHAKNDSIKQTADIMRTLYSPLV